MKKLSKLSSPGPSRSNPVLHNPRWIVSSRASMTSWPYLTGCLAITAALALTSSLLFTNNPTRAATESTQSANSDLNLSISSVVSLSLTNCNPSETNPDTITLTIDPSFDGKFASTCQNINVAANTPGYSLSIKSSSTDLLYQNPTTITPSPIVPSTPADISVPTKLPNDTWGFAIEKQDGMTSAFDTTHTTNNADNKYAKLLTTDQTIYQTDKALGETPAPLSNFTAYYGVRLTLATVAGEYKTTITYTAIGEVVPEPIYPEVLAIVPNIASTKVPNGNGTGSNGPQFSIAGSNFGANPTVTIGGQPCTEITVNSAGTALTCSGPTSDLSAGDKAVVVTDTIGNKSSNKDKTVTYDATDYSTLQSLTNATCQNLPLRLTGSDPATIFRDARDSQLYYVARLAGNKCWMLDNLKYKPNGDTTGTVTPGFPATQVANTYTANYLTQDGTSTTTSPNQDAAKYIDPISQAYCYNNTNKSTYNITKCGLLYNYHTATAGTNIQANYSAADRNASGSICPANWRLPSGYDASGDFGVLDKAYLPGGTGSYHDLSNPDTQGLWQYSGAFAGVFSGDYFSSFYDQGIYGRLWSSSANSAIYGNVLYFNSSDVRPGTYNVKRFYGVGVRCVIDS